MAEMKFSGLLDHEEKTLTRDELTEYLEYREGNDKWITPFVNECAIVAFDDSMNKEICSSEAKMDVSVAYTEARNSDTKMILVYPDNFVPQAMPVRYTAINDICSRAGLWGRTVENDTPSKDIGVLPGIIRGQWLSTGFSLNSQETKILVRDGKVGAMKSFKYQPISQKKAVEVLEDAIKEDFENLTFSNATVSHEYLQVNYNLNAVEQEESFRLLLESMGKGVKEVTSMLMFVTSDVGNSSVRAMPFITIDKCPIRLGEKAYLRHEGENNLEKFREILKNVAVSLKEAEDRIEELGNISIEHPYDTLIRISDKLLLPKTESKSVAENLVSNYPNGCDAIDIFIALNEIVEKKASSSNLNEIIKLQEKVASCIYLDYSRYDRLID